MRKDIAMQTHFPVSVRLQFVLEELEKIMQTLEEEEALAEQHEDFLTRS